MQDRRAEQRQYQPLVIDRIEPHPPGEFTHSLTVGSDDLAWTWSDFKNGRKYTTLVWPGTIDFSTINETVADMHQKVTGNPLDFSNKDDLKRIEISLITGDAGLIEGKLSSKRIWKRFQEYTNDPSQISFARFDIAMQGPKGKIAFTAINPEEGERHEVAIGQDGETQAWTEDLVEWIVDHHDSKDSLKGNVNLAEIAGAVTKISNPSTRTS